MEHPGLGINAEKAAISIIVWSVAVMAWSLIAVVRGTMKPSRPPGIVWLVLAVGLIACGLFVADESWSDGNSPTVQVIDGDTLRIGGQTVRLFGVDAPELKQLCHARERDYACGQRAREYLESLVRGKRVECRVLSDDRYGRHVSLCVIDGQRDLAYQMVLAGWALDYRQYSDGHYEAPERRARLLKRGMWAGKILAPWDWRRR
ncbi:MAG: thermonuclease family protein [Rhodobacteraceae bacterium]|nr:thermonuclease family protein [Paracoccaceae bacterium]